METTRDSRLEHLVYGSGQSVWLGRRRFGLILVAALLFDLGPTVTAQGEHRPPPYAPTPLSGSPGTRDGRLSSCTRLNGSCLATRRRDSGPGSWSARAGS